MMLPRRQRATDEGGYALMVVMFIAAAASVMLALSLPRIAMQSQRAKEQRLIYRGEQYARAVELYFRKYNKYPESLDDLEETDNIRFLRRRYRDPLTGEDEWRLIHMGADGRFKDSAIYDKVEEEEQEERNPYSIQPRAPIGSSGFQSYSDGYRPPDGRFRGAQRARQAQQNAPVPAQQGGAAPPAVPGAPQVDPGYPQPGQTPGVNPVPGAPGQAPGVPGQVGAPAAPLPGQPGYVPDPQGVAQQNAPNTMPVGNDAAAIIRQQLFGPNPRGNPFNRNQQQQGAAAAGGPQASFQEGVAGVASKVEDWGVKTYRGQDFYNLWEFVYDYREDKRFGGQGGTEGVGTGPKRPGAPAVVTAQPGTTASPYLPAGATRPSVATPGVPGTPNQNPGQQPSNPNPGYDDRPNLPTGYPPTTNPGYDNRPNLPIGFPPTGPAPQ